MSGWARRYISSTEMRFDNMATVGGILMSVPMGIGAWEGNRYLRLRAQAKTRDDFIQDNPSAGVDLPYYGKRFGFSTDYLIECGLKTGDVVLVSYDIMNLHCWDAALLKISRVILKAKQKSNFDEALLVWKEHGQIWVASKHDRSTTIRRQKYSELLATGMCQTVAVRRLETNDDDRNTGNNNNAKQGLRQRVDEALMRRFQQGENQVTSPCSIFGTLWLACRRRLGKTSDLAHEWREAFTRVKSANQFRRITGARVFDMVSNNAVEFENILLEKRKEQEFAWRQAELLEILQALERGLLGGLAEEQELYRKRPKSTAMLESSAAFVADIMKECGMLPEWPTSGLYLCHDLEQLNSILYVECCDDAPSLSNVFYVRMDGIEEFQQEKAMRRSIWDSTAMKQTYRG